MRVSTAAPPPEKRPINEKVLVFPGTAVDHRFVAAVRAFAATKSLKGLWAAVVL